MIFFLSFLFWIAQAHAFPVDRVEQTATGEYVLVIHIRNEIGTYNEYSYRIQSDRLRHLTVPSQENGTQISLIIMSFPTIHEQRLCVTSWKITSERTGYSHFFTFLFNLDSEDPNEPFYNLQSKTYSGLYLNHEAAEEWATFYFRPVSPMRSHSPSVVRDDEEYFSLDDSKTESPASRLREHRPSRLSISNYQRAEEDLFEPLLNRSESEPSSKD